MSYMVRSILRRAHGNPCRLRRSRLSEVCSQATTPLNSLVAGSLPSPGSARRVLSRDLRGRTVGFPAVDEARDAVVRRRWRGMIGEPVVHGLGDRRLRQDPLAEPQQFLPCSKREAAEVPALKFLDERAD